MKKLKKPSHRALSLSLTFLLLNSMPLTAAFAEQASTQGLPGAQSSSSFPSNQSDFSTAPTSSTQFESSVPTEKESTLSSRQTLWEATHNPNTPAYATSGSSNNSGKKLASAALPKNAEAGANQEKIPKQILKTGVNLATTGVSPNGVQLAEQLGLLPYLKRIQSLRGRIDPTNFESTPENLATSQQLTASTVMSMQIIDEANLSVDFVLAEINAEQNIYSELLSTFSSDRDKTVFKTNAASFITNGILWALAEAYDIPTNRHPNFSTTSGTLGILAGIVPSIASGIALYQLNGKKETSEKDPNMLSRLLGYPATEDIDYPKPVWDFLMTMPASGGASSKSRKEQLIDRWISDKNIPNFTDRSSKEQLDIITASTPRKKGLSISTLNARQQLLQQLSAEVLKMKRLLYELSMTVRGTKQI
jgi:hypothetical protein